PARHRGPALALVVHPQLPHPAAAAGTIGGEVSAHLGRRDRLAASALHAPPGRTVAASITRRAGALRHADRQPAPARRAEGDDRRWPRTTDRPADVPAILGDDHGLRKRLPL